VKAYRLPAWETRPRMEDVDVPEPGPGQVLIKVGGAGACHSDLHLSEWPPGVVPFEPPFTIGHENAGWVEQVGPGVEGLELGEPVAVFGSWGCGRCAACRVSEENYCEHQAELGHFGGGLGLDGGMAEYMLVPHPRLLLPLGDLDPRDAAPLTDAALTPYQAVKRSLGILGPGSTAVVIGVGGLGHLAIQILSALCPAKVIAVDTSAEKLELAKRLGAEVAVAAGEGAAAEIREANKGRGADLVIDLVGAQETIDLAAAVVQFKSHLTVVGLAGGKLPFDFSALPFATQLTFISWGSGIELAEVLALAEAGKIETEVERFSLDQAEEAYRRVHDGTLSGRAVVCPHG
jgi:alcohol dehydrogenase, propanol-preferring